MSKYISFVVLLVLALAIAACAAPVAPAPAAQATAAPAAQATAAPAAQATAAPADPIRIGLLAPVTGAFAGLGEDNVTGVKMALEELNYTIAGRPVELFVEDTQLDADVAIEKARALVNRDKVDIIIGPLSGGESLAVKKAAGEWPDVTFLMLGASNEITMKEIAPNVYRPGFAGGQPVYPLAEWAFNNGIKRIATAGEDYAFPWDQIGGFVYAFCKLGGKTVKSYWTPIGTADYSSVVSDLKNQDVDAVFVAYGGADSINFTKQMNDFGLIGKVKILAGSSFGDASTLEAVGELLDGTMSGSLYSGDLPYPEFKKFNDAFIARMNRPSTLFAENFYTAAMLVNEATKATNGNVEDREAWRKALSEVKFNAPRGPISFDQYHNTTGTMYLNQVKNVDGKWINTVVEQFPDIGQYYRFDQKEFDAALPFGRDNPQCP